MAERAQRWRDRVFGQPLDPMAPGARHGVALVALLAWIGLGADGLSSSAYGPPESYIALGEYSSLALYLAVASAVTVFVIALAYNQVIELFPSGGGGYKVATRLIGPSAGLIAGSALIVDYVLTIAISVASGVEAILSFLPDAAHVVRLELQVGLVIVLTYMNLRGMRESIAVLTPIFIGFVLTHLVILGFGIGYHATRFDDLVVDTVHATRDFASQQGTWTVALAVLSAYAMGGGTYTGIEAVSNNVNTLKEPRVRTGKWTMFLMALSLALTAGGIMLLYLLWDVPAVETTRTLNAVAFERVIGAFHLTPTASHAALTVTLLFEGALLFVAANTGFLGGPAVLANLAADRWAPNMFSSLSARLVAKHGVLLMGAAAILILLGTSGNVSLLVILYAVNVFLAFSLSMLGLVRYWWARRGDAPRARRRVALSSAGLVVTTGILAVTVAQRFATGALAALAITGIVAGCGFMIRRHYDRVRALTSALENQFRGTFKERVEDPPVAPRDAPTAVLLVSANRGIGMHMIERIRKLFPGHFENFVFLSVGTVDTGAFGSDAALRQMQYLNRGTLEYLVNYLHHEGVAASWRDDYGTDRVALLTDLCDSVRREYPSSVFFAARLLFDRENWWNRWLHNQTPLAMQRLLNQAGAELIVIPVCLSQGDPTDTAPREAA
jgi:amino acid transporter